MIGPAFEINRYCEKSGFIVGCEGVREGKSFTKIKFVVTKTAARDDRDSKLQGKARRAIAFDAPPGMEGRIRHRSSGA